MALIRKFEPASVSDLLAKWAAEEFVAAGRVSLEDRATHRERALFFADALAALNEGQRQTGLHS